MKAKDYFQEYQDLNQDKSPEWRLITAFRQMTLEVNEIVKMRSAKSNSALISIFNEQLLKANSFTKMVNETADWNGSIIKDAFKVYLQGETPELAKLIWKE